MNLNDNKQDTSVRGKIYRIIRIGYTGDVPSRIFDIVIAAAILINLFIIFFETFDASEKYLPVLGIIELVTVVIFTVEYILRLAVADMAFPEKKTRPAAMLAFALSLYGIIDLLSFLPYWLMLFFPQASVPSGIVAFRMLRVVRILRLFRINRYYDAFNVITDVIKQKKNQILSALFIILMMVLASSIIMYNLEHEAQPDAFRNAFSGIWWAVSTLLTVGYGDIYPVTAAGRFVGIILAFLGVGIVAIPTGIISAGFVEQYTKIRDLEGLNNERPVDHILVYVTQDHSWCNKRIGDIHIADGIVMPAILRGDSIMIPGDDTVMEAGDRVVLASKAGCEEDVQLLDIEMGKGSDWPGRTVSEFERDHKLACVSLIRGTKPVDIDGDTVIGRNDTLLVLRKLYDRGGKM